MFAIFFVSKFFFMNWSYEANVSNMLVMKSGT